MNVTCPACSARYKADDEKLRGKTARMRCKGCGTVWLVSGPSSQSAPPSSDERRAAVVRRGAERERRDLFASRPPEQEMGSVHQTMRPPPITSGVGARNENSVLFRVDQLATTGRVKTPEPERAPAPASLRTPEDDEGIIDLLALSSAPPPRHAAAPLAPLFPSDAPPAAFARDAGSTAPQAMSGGKWKLFAAIAAAAAFVLFAGLGVAIAFRGEEPVARTAAVAPPAPPPPAVTATAEPAPEPKTAATASASSDDEDDASEAATPKKGKGKRKGRGGKGGKAKKAAASTKPAAPPKAPKAADPCHCKGDFNCILACTAKGHK